VVAEIARRLDRSRFQPWVVLPPAGALDPWVENLRRQAVPVERLAEVTSRWQWGLLARTASFLGRHRHAILTR